MIKMLSEFNFIEIRSDSTHSGERETEGLLIQQLHSIHECMHGQHGGQARQVLKPGEHEHMCDVKS